MLLASPACEWVSFGGDPPDAGIDGGPTGDGDADADADADGDGDADADADADSDADADADGDGDGDSDADADADGDADHETCTEDASCAELSRRVFDAINAHRAGDPHPWDDRVARACTEHARNMAASGNLTQDGLGPLLDAEGVDWLDVGGDLSRVDTTVAAMVDRFFDPGDDDWTGDPRPTGVGAAPDANGTAVVCAIVIFSEQ